MYQTTSIICDQVYYQLCFWFFDKPLTKLHFQDKITTISMQPQQYVCKFIEAEVQHVLKTESRKVNEAPLEAEFCLANGIIDIIMLTDLEDHTRPMRHPYYAPLPIIVYFDQLSDISRNADGTID